PATALLTDMSEPLASAAGNALEVAYAVDHLTGRRREPRFHAVTVALGAEMLRLGGLAADHDEAERRMEEALRSGAAAERFARMVGALGGPVDLLERPDAHLASAPVRLTVEAKAPGVVFAIDTRAVGLAVVRLGGGRTRPQDAIDPAVGFTDLAGVGDEAGRIGIVHARTEAAAQVAAEALRQAYRVGDQAPSRPPLVRRLA
ncbi:MAG: thymidine phosphorylase, partial [Methylobacteriaceae bacterium]|nr:thymidine phosphorylase [Methylobacteriaceae bacterium]